MILVLKLIFKDKSEALGVKGDILVCISTGGGDKLSGASMNLVHAAKTAKKQMVYH